MQELRKEELFKVPGIAETLDWVNALVALNQGTVSEEVAEETLGVLLKYQDDVELVRGARAGEILKRAAASST